MRLEPPDLEEVVGSAGATLAEAEAAAAGLGPIRPDHEVGVAPAEAASRPAGGGASKRSTKWPPGSSSTPWQLAPIVNGGVQIGWGATCSCHSNQDEVTAGKNIKCKKQIITSAGMTHDGTRLLAMQWLVRGGLEIPADHATGRTEHVFNKQPRRFEPMEEADQEAMAMALWP